MIKPVNSNFYEVAFSNNRLYDIKVETVAVSPIDISDYIQSIKITEQLNTNTYTLGANCSSMCEVDMLVPSGVVLKSLGFTVQVGFKVGVNQGVDVYEYIPMGTFITSEVSTTDNYFTCHLIAYDKMAYLTADYVPSASLSDHLISTLVTDICTVNGLTLKSGQTFPSVSLEWYNDGTSVREQLGYIASIMGTSVRINRENELEFTKYALHTLDTTTTTSSTYASVSNNEIYLGELGNDSQEDYVVSAIQVQNDTETPLTSGSGRSCIFYNPYIENQDMCDSVLARMGTLTYRTASFKYRGNPCYEVGDIVQLNGVNVCIMQQTWELGSGVSATIDSFGLSDNDIILSKNNGVKTLIKRQATQLEKAFTQVTDIMKGQGGYIVDIYENGVKVGIKIVNNADSNYYWQWKYGALAFTTDGGSTWRNIALTNDGQIMANSITAGVMSAERISVGEETDTLGQYFKVERDQQQNVSLVIGSNNNEMKLVETGNEIGFYAKDENNNWQWVAKFTPNGLSFKEASFTGLNLGNWDMGTDGNNFNIFYKG